jgi:uncharacterized protein YfaS (alpha-2-macroglobulin family)
MFNQPMVALGDFDEADQSLLTLDPPLPGKVVWINQYTLAFVADTPATVDLQVEVTLSPEVTSLAGARLDGPRTVAFTLPRSRLEVEWSRLAGGYDPVAALRPVVSASFSRPVYPDSVNGKSFFVWGPEDAPGRIPARWTRLRNRPEATHRLRAEPETALPKGISWSLVIDGDASRAPGRPPLGEELVVAAGGTYGDLEVTPYGFDEIRGSGPDATGVLLKPEDAYLVLRFSNPVMMSRAAAFIEMDPPHYEVAELRNRWVRRGASPGASSGDGASPGPGASSADGASPGPGSSADGEAHADPEVFPEDEGRDIALDDSIRDALYLHTEFLGETDYVITVRKGFPDIYGQTLAEDRVIRFRTGPLTPMSGQDSPGGIMESAFPPIVPVWIRNLAKAEFFARVMTDAEAARMLDVWPMRFGGGPHRHAPAGARDWLVANRMLPGLYAEEVVPVGDSAKRRVRQPLDLSGLTGGREKEGVVLAFSRGGDGYSLFQVTDLAITAKLGSSGSIAWVTRLSDASPVPGAAVRALDCAGKELWAGETGADGLARLPAVSGLAGDVTARCGKGARGFGIPELHLAASKDGERVFWSTAWSYGSYPSRDVAERVSPFSPDRVDSFLVTSQPIYRPGETARLKAVIRRLGPDGLFPPDPGGARAIIFDSGGAVAFDGPVEVSPYGTVALDYGIPEDAAYGEWRLAVDLAPEKSRPADSLYHAWNVPDLAIAGGFAVRFYRTPAFELALDGMPDLYAGDAAAFGVKGTFHYGAPLDGGEAEFELRRRPDWDYRPPGYGPEWSFTYASLAKGDEGGRDEGGIQSLRAAEGKATIAADGTASFKAAIPADGAPVPRSYTLAVTAFDLDGRAVSASGSFLAHPARLYAGLSAEGFLAEAGKPFPLKVAVSAPDGTPAPGTEVKVSLYRRAWSSARRLAVGGNYEAAGGFDDRLVSELTVTAGDSPVGIELVPEGAGMHFATAELTDPEGRTAAASLDFWVAGEGGAGWRERDGESAELVADAPEYRPGDVARILVQSPFSAGTGLLTVERGGVREARVFDLAGGAPVLEIPIGHDDAPSVYASVVLVRGRTAPPPGRGAEDLGKPAFRRGYLALRVLPERDRLNVELVPDREEAAPGARVSVRIRVTDSAGNPFPGCEVALAAVDAGLIQIGGDDAFRPEGFLWRDLPLRVETVSSLGVILDAADWSGKGGGTPGGGGGDSSGVPGGLRRDFRPVAHFDPALEPDENGEVEASFRLPDGFTSYRIFAVATGKGRETGTGEGRITATRALVLRSALPSHLTVGDEFQASAVVTSRAAARAELAVEFLPGAGLEAREDTRKSLALNPGESVEVAFRARAVAAGALEAGFRATLDGHSDRSLFAVPVTPAGRLTADASVSVEGAGSSLPEAGLPAGADPSRGGLELVFSPGVAGTLDAPLGALADYPYFCLEQSTSKAAGALYGLRLGKLSGTLEDARREELEARVKAQIALLGSRELGGGFHAWPDGGRESRSPVLTAWVLDFMREARDDGFDVPDGLVGRAADYLAEELAGGPGRPESGVPRRSDSGVPRRSDSVSLYVMGALFRAGRPQEGTFETCYERRGEFDAVQRILLLRAASALPPSSVRDGQLAELVPMVASGLELSGATARTAVPDGLKAHELWLSGAGDVSAQALLALSEAAPGHALLPALLLGSVSSGRGNVWSTNRAVSVLRGAWNFLEAGGAAGGVAAPDLAVKVLQGDRTVMEGRLDGARAPELRASLTAAELLSGPPPSWDIGGRGELWSFRRLSWVPGTPDLSVQGARGLALTRSFRRVRPEPGPAGESAFRRGEAVKVTVTLMTDVARYNLALEDPVPAGFEPVDFHLRDQNPNLAAELEAAEPEPEGAEPEDDAPRTDDPWALLWNWYDHEEIRPDSVRLFADELEPGVYTYSYLARAVTPGTYALPGPYAEEMYNPENHGRGAGLRITVEK